MSFAMSAAGYDAFWAAFLAAIWTFVVVAAAVFAYYEGPGLKRGGEPNTLSAWIRRHLGIEPRNPRRYRLGVAFILTVCLAGEGFFFWFGYHIVFGRGK